MMRLLADARRDAPKAVSLVLNTELTGHDHPIEERLLFKRPERMRLASIDDTTTIAVVKEGLAAAGEERAIRPTGPSKNILASLLYPRGRDLDEASARLLKTLAAVGIDSRVVSLGRNEEQIVYIIGAQPWEAERPQVWLDKVSFLPVRLRVAASQAGPAASGTASVASNAAGATGTATAVAERAIGMTEARYLEYGGGSVPGLPRVFEEYVNGNLVRHGEVVSGQVHTDLPEALFDVSGAPTRRR
ncbi:MAG: hypothetical protein EOO40_09895 [Deltaproteobacteria bacterium]|nr:MAG: hypothetical protein EOO40_09895 [Deltaproteobacteria bacterium]